MVVLAIEPNRVPHHDTERDPNGATLSPAHHKPHRWAFREICVIVNDDPSLLALVELPLMKGACLMSLVNIGSPTPGPTWVPSTAPTRTPTTAPTALAAVVSLVSNHYFRASSSIPVVNSHEALVLRGSTNFVLTGGTWTSPNATLRAAIGTA